MKNYLEKLIPLHIKDIKKGIGSFVTFNFTNDHILWIYLCDWEIIDLKIKKVLLNSNNINSNNYIDLFDKISLHSITKIECNDNAINFYLNDSFLITLFENLNEYEDDDELFIFFKNDKSETLSYAPKNGFILETIWLYKNANPAKKKIKSEIKKTPISKKYRFKILWKRALSKSNKKLNFDEKSYLTKYVLEDLIKALELLGKINDSLYNYRNIYKNLKFNIKNINILNDFPNIQKWKV